MRLQSAFSIFTGRRAALKLLGMSAAVLLGWPVFRRRAAAYPASHLAGYLSGNRYPVSQGAWQAEHQPDLDAYCLRLGGAVSAPCSWRYPDLLARPAASLVATLGCMDGWHTTQTWQGIPLRDLLAAARPAPGAAYVRLESQAGFVLTLTLEEANQVLLATGVGGEPLALDHGFPLRAVIPALPGRSWLKGLASIQVIVPPSGSPSGGSRPGDMALGAYTLGEDASGDAV